MSDWHPIDETAPKDLMHVRGLWVMSAKTGEPLWWEPVAGYVDDDGDFLMAGGDACGWRADDFTHWIPLPAAPQESSDATIPDRRRNRPSHMGGDLGDDLVGDLSTGDER